MFTPKPDIILYCGECGGELNFDMTQGEIHVELCDTCAESIRQQAKEEEEK